MLTYRIYSYKRHCPDKRPLFSLAKKPQKYSENIISKKIICFRKTHKNKLELVRKHTKTS